MRLTKLFLLALLSFMFIGLSRGKKLECAKEESKPNQKSSKKEAEGNKIVPADSVTKNKPRVSFVLSVKPKDKNVKKLFQNNENMEAIREKLMKTLLEKGEIKNVNSREFTSEETVTRNHMESKHEEVWALMDEIMKRKNFLRKEIEEFHKRGLPKPPKRRESQDSEQNDANSDEDYSEENFSDEEKESESEEFPDEGVSFEKPYKKDKTKLKYRGAAAPIILKVNKASFPKTEKYPDKAGTVLEDIPTEEVNKRNKNELRNKNMQLSKLFVQQMKEIYDMENRSRKAKRAKRHYDSQIPLPYEEPLESLECVERIQRKGPKKRPSNKKKIYIIDDPLGFYYYFKKGHKKSSNDVEVYPTFEPSKNKASKKKNNKKRPQRLKMQRLLQQNRRCEKDGILIKQIEENHLSDPNNSDYFEYLLLPQSTKLQAKYLHQNGKEVNWNKKEMLIPNSGLTNYYDWESAKQLKLPDNRNSGECEKIHQQVLTNGPNVLSSEDKYIGAPLESTTESDVIINNQINNDTQIDQFLPEKQISNSTTGKEPNIQLNSSQLQELKDNSQTLLVAASSDGTIKSRIPRSYRSKNYRTPVDSIGDCSECASNEYEPQEDSSNWDELNMYISLLKKILEDKSLEDLDLDSTNTESTSVTAESKAVTDLSVEEDTEYTDSIVDTTKSYIAESSNTESSTTESLTAESVTAEPLTTTPSPTESSSTEPPTAYSITPFVVSPGNNGLNLNKIVEEINEAVGSQNSDIIVPFENPPVGRSEAGQPTEKNEQPLLLKRAKGYWLPLKLVQNHDGRFNIQLDLKYICRRCTKERQKRMRKQQRRSSNESY